MSVVYAGTPTREDVLEEQRCWDEGTLLWKICEMALTQVPRKREPCDCDHNETCEKCRGTTA